ncbi:HTH-type transcriptional repressor YtrA [Aureliella helgolandensis]|uniref:HTH-type transcriptional repressor YtrA n=1 Tax=Aureliella helgolandensis TaxID=2527968 RepID=A0A518G3U0_9BACT|nr:HTH-type transcriptional repressor YtrA [Aureliella helgolandensis]
MQLQIDPNDGIPIYEQLIRQVKYAVAEGVLVPGQVIPSVREMAKLIAVNPNTVQRAYLQLQDETVLEALRGRGMAVCQNARLRCVSDRQQMVAERMDAVVDEGVRSGLAADPLREMFENSLRNATQKSEGQS